MSGSTCSSYNVSEGAAQPRVDAAGILDIIEYWLPIPKVQRKGTRRSVVCLQPAIEVIDYHSDEAKKYGKPTRLNIEHQQLDQVLAVPVPQKILSTTARKNMRKSRPPQVKAGCECIIS